MPPVISQEPSPHIACPTGLSGGTVPWQRLACGLWRVPQGDIAAAYSAHCLPNVRTFVHDGTLFTTTALVHRFALRTEARCHPLVLPDRYDGPPRGERGYEGMEVLHRKVPFRLGPETVFVSSDPTAMEWRHHLRAVYADAGRRVEPPCYRDFLDALETDERPAYIQALCLERASPEARFTREEMQHFLASGEAPPQRQMDLGF